MVSLACSMWTLLTWLGEAFFTLRLMVVTAAPLARPLPGGAEVRSYRGYWATGNEHQQHTTAHTQARWRRSGGMSSRNIPLLP